MLAACRTNGEGFAIPTFELVPSDVEGFMEELWEFQSAFHDCFARSEPRAHFFDYLEAALGKKKPRPSPCRSSGRYWTSSYPSGGIPLQRCWR